MIREIMSYSMGGVVDLPAIMMVLLAYVLLIFICLPFHEFAHAFLAYRLGDNTARFKGRLTINPFAHLSLVGTLMMLTVGVGYAKPVPVNPLNFKNRKLGMALTSLAGPLSNLLLAFLSMVGLKVGLLLGANAYVCLFFSTLVSINIGLTVFNLLPIPPLDGSRVLTLFLDERQYFKIMRYEQYIMIGFILLVFSGVLDVPLALLNEGLWNLMDLMTFFLG